MMRDLLYIAAIAVLCSIEFVHGGSPFLLQGSPPYVTLPEDYPVGNELFLFHISDSDIGDTVTLTPADTETSIYINITATTGNNITAHVMLRRELNREEKDRLALTFAATDKPGNQITISKTVYITDVNDNAPQFQNQPYSMDIPELPCNLTTVYTGISTKDSDSGNNGTVRYRMESEAWRTEYMATFTIDNTNQFRTYIYNKYSTCPWCFVISTIQGQGVITANSTLDRDTGIIEQQSGICILTVLAKEKVENRVEQSHQNKTTTDVTITIDDVNDNSPEFAETFYTATVPENTPSNVPLTISPEINVKDTDQGRNARMRFTIQYENGSACTDFKVSPTEIQGSGNIIILVNNQDVLDYEIKQQINISVIATEIENSNHTSKTNVWIEISDTNDNNPMLNMTNWVLSVPENSPNNTRVGQITATDKDTPSVNKFIRYSISGGYGRFVVNSTTGEIRTNCLNCSVELDREKQDVYYLMYTAKYGGDRSNSVSLVVNLTDVNDEKPTFNRDVYQALIPENDAQYSSTPVVKLDAKDNDEVGTNNSAILYSILNSSEVGFIHNLTVKNPTGEIFLLSPIDYEKVNNKDRVINITVKAADQGNPPMSSTSVVVLSIQHYAQESSTDNASERNMHILLAVSAAEAIVISVLICVYCSTRHKYQRKLKAANIKTTDMALHAVYQNEIDVPGINMHYKHGLSRNATRWAVYVGKHHLDRPDTTETLHHVKQIILHPGFDNVSLANDLALLKLQEPILFTDFVRPVCIPPTRRRMVAVNTACYTTGWGDTRGTGDRSVLNQVMLPLIGDYFCGRNDWYGAHFVIGLTFCAGYFGGGKDACTGDSGGPFNCKVDGKWYVQGVSSWGHDCAQPKWPGIYTDVSKYGTWIHDILLAEGVPLID